MASCAYCNTTILFGAKRQGELRFCNAKCQAAGALSAVAAQLPQFEVERTLMRVHGGTCPECDGSGPVDVHTSYRVWSALLVTNWSSRPAVCCRGCGVKRKLLDSVFSFSLGWWGFPWGLLVTPVQVVRNIAGLFFAPDPSRPSPALEKLLRLRLAAAALSPQQGVERSV